MGLASRWGVESSPAVTHELRSVPKPGRDKSCRHMQTEDMFVSPLSACATIGLEGELNASKSSEKKETLQLSTKRIKPTMILAEN